MNLFSKSSTDRSGPITQPGAGSAQPEATSVGEPRTILFVDLRGSTSLYLRLGNAQAALVVTQSLTLLSHIVSHGGGRVVKSLGDGLMAEFTDVEQAVEAADEMHESLERIIDVPGGAQSAGNALKLKVAMARGELIEMDGDCFGDAVNVAARLLDLAGDNETLATASLVDVLPSDQRERFRSLDRLHLRGRSEPVGVYRMEGRRFGDTVSTQFQEPQASDLPDGLRMSTPDDCRIHPAACAPIVIGRSPQATYCLDDSRVSRTHARIESHSGHFQLTDLSYNGTYVRFGNEDQVVALRRGTCTLHGSGVISLGAPPTDPTAACVRFEVLSFADTVPRHDD